MDEVIERYTKARGGRAALEAIEAIEFELHIADTTFQIDGTYSQRRSDFRTVAGVQFAVASTETDLQSGQVLETTTVRSVKVNPPLIPSIFENR